MLRNAYQPQICPGTAGIIIIIIIIIIIVIYSHQEMHMKSTNISMSSGDNKGQLRTR